MTKTFMDMVQEARQEVQPVSAQEAQTKVEQDPSTLIVDVREPSGIAETGAIPGSLNVPLGMLAISADQQLPEEMRHADLQDRSRQVVTTCGLGGQAALAAKTLKDMGFSNVRFIDEGFKGWQEAGLPIEQRATSG